MGGVTCGVIDFDLLDSGIGNRFDASSDRTAMMVLCCVVEAEGWGTVNWSPRKYKRGEV